MSQSPPSDNLTRFDERMQASMDLGYGPSTDAGKLQEKYIAAVKSATTNYGGNLHTFSRTLLHNYATHLETLSRPENGFKGNMLSFDAYAQSQYEANGAVIDKPHIDAARNALFSSQEFRNLSPLVFKGQDSVAPQARVYTAEELARAKASAEKQAEEAWANKNRWEWSQELMAAKRQVNEMTPGSSFLSPQEEAQALEIAATRFGNKHQHDPKASMMVASFALKSQANIYAAFDSGKSNQLMARAGELDQQVAAMGSGQGSGNVASTGHGGPAGGGGFMNAAYNAAGGSKGFGGMVKEYGQWGGALLGAIVGGMFGGGGFLGIFIGALLGIALGNGFKDQIGSFIDSKFPAKPRTPGGNAPSRGAGATLVSAPRVVSGEEQEKPVGLVVLGQDNALLTVTNENDQLVVGVPDQKHLIMSNTGLPATITYKLEQVGVTATGEHKAQMRITGLSVGGMPVSDDKIKALRALPVNGKEVDLSSLSSPLAMHVSEVVIPGKVAAINDNITSGMTKEQKEATLSGNAQEASFTYRHAMSNGMYVQLPLKGELKQDGNGWSLTVSDSGKAIPEYYDVAGNPLSVDRTSLLLDKNGDVKPLVITGLQAPAAGQTMEDYIKQNAEAIRSALSGRTADPASPSADKSGMLNASVTPPPTPGREAGSSVGAQV